MTAWCRRHGKWLVAGGPGNLSRSRMPRAAPGGIGYRDWRPCPQEEVRRIDTSTRAFVIGPGGTVVHRRAKSRPIQFFRDGEPAWEQRVWDSPWGRLGILICYDASYRRVTDPLVRQGSPGAVACQRWIWRPGASINIDSMPAWPASGRGIGYSHPPGGELRHLPDFGGQRRSGPRLRFPGPGV